MAKSASRFAATNMFGTAFVYLKLKIKVTVQNPSKFSLKLFAIRVIRTCNIPADEL